MIILISNISHTIIIFERLKMRPSKCVKFNRLVETVNLVYIITAAMRSFCECVGCVLSHIFLCLSNPLMY